MYLLLKKSKVEEKDVNLKIAVDLLKKENYEDPTDSQKLEMCKNLKLRDSDNKGLSITCL
jgi:hypothetical protein